MLVVPRRKATLSSDTRSVRDLTRKLCYRKDDCAMRPIMSASHVSSQSQTRVKLNKVFVRFLVSPNFPHVPLRAGG